MDLKYLSPEQCQQFMEDGFLVVASFLDAREVSRVKHDIEAVSREHAAMTKDADGLNLEKADGAEPFDTTASARRAGLFRKIQGAVFHIPAVRDVFSSEKMLDCMQDLMGPSIHYHSSKVMFKPAGGCKKPWHQDAAYWKKYLPEQITVWIAIDDATEENGCVWAIPGSHKLGHIPHVRRELQVEESRIDLDKAAPVPVMSGGLLIFHSLVLHMSHRNDSDLPRCAIICDYAPQANPVIDRIPALEADVPPIPGLRADGVWPLRTAATAAQ